MGPRTEQQQVTNRVGLNASPEANKRPDICQTYYKCSFPSVCRGMSVEGSLRGVDATVHLPHLGVGANVIGAGNAPIFVCSNNGDLQATG
jgi:hypothetical protein